MNFSLFESVLGRQRCRQWTPLYSQQLRLRHLYQIMGYNLTSEREGSFYYTLHLTSMCAPFYTSEKINNPNPKWAEISIKMLPSLSISAFVIRIWQERPSEIDDIVLFTWGVNLSGLAYLGDRLSAVQPCSFAADTLVFHMRGGYFASHATLRTDQKPPPFIDSLNVACNQQQTRVFRVTGIRVPPNEATNSYNVQKLQRLHRLQIAIRNKTMETKLVRDRIGAMCSSVGDDVTDVRGTVKKGEEEGGVRYAPQLLTMNSLNRMLQGRSTKAQRQEVKRIREAIEVARFKTKLLSQEKDKKSANLRRLKQRYNDLTDENEERNSTLMENYHKLNKEAERMKEWKQLLVQHKDILSHCSYQLHHRRRQLLQQLLFIYPIKQVNEHKFIISGIYLPSSDLLTDCSDGGLAVALGYVTHVLTMCSIFLQVPLRYPMIHYGSRSHIIDHISPQLSERDRDFPLFTKSKDRDLFNYAVYLLNKNIAQLRLLCGLHTPDLKSTLPNLLGLLQGKGYRAEAEPPPTRPDLSGRFPSLRNFATSGVGADPVLEPMKSEQRQRTDQGRFDVKRTPKTECGPGLSEILAIPEAYLNREITTSCLKNYIAFEKHKKTNGASYSSYDSHVSLIKEERGTPSPPTDHKNGEIEQGTDLLSPSADINSSVTKTITIMEPSQPPNKYQKPISRSVGSYTDDEGSASRVTGSDPLINVRGGAELPPSSEEGQGYLRQWLDGGRMTVCSEENLYPEEVFAGTSRERGGALEARMDALLNTKSFNLVRPRYE